MSISFWKLGKFSFIIFFQIDFQFISVSLLLLAFLWCECWNAWSCPKVCLDYPCFFKFFFLLAVLIKFLSPLCSKLLIWFLASCTILLFPCKLLFQLVYLSFLTGSYFMLLRSSLTSLCILITNVLNYASDRLLFLFNLVLFLEFWSVLSFGPSLCILAASLCLFLCIR